MSRSPSPRCARILPIRLAVWSIGSLLFAAASCIGQPVRIESGLIDGPIEGSCRVFKGVPYAQAPVGDLRWREPQPPGPWSGIREADAFAAICPQKGASVPGAPSEPMSEDCLYLNIWVPRHAAEDKLPVMVWLFGGGWTTGSATMPLYAGDRLASRGVILVTVGYRVGAFGFLAHPELSRESPHRASGNYGLLDQIAALQWIRRDIAAFGGDPHRVTIFGQSAGSMSVCLLMSSPLAHGLFQRAIGESGGVFSPPAAVPGSRFLFLKGAEETGLALQKQLGAASLADLRRLPADDILKASQNLPVLFAFDGYVLPQQPYDTFLAGGQNDVPLLLGSNADEGLPFLEGVTVLSSRFTSDLQRTAFAKIPPAVLLHYPSATDDEARASRAALERDVRFGWDTWTWARLQARTGRAGVFYYHFAHVPPVREDSPWKHWGVGHWAELPYVFGHPEQAPGAWSAEDYALSTAMIGYWTNFAKQGDPNGPGLPGWPAFTAARPEVLHFDDTIHVGGVANEDKLEALDRFFTDARGPAVAAPLK